MRKVRKILLVIACSVCCLLLTRCADSDEGGLFFDNDDPGVSLSGSIARFHIYDDFLYVLETGSLSVFDISDTSQVVRERKLLISQEAETIFRFDTVLYLGTTTGVLLYNISEPGMPEFLSVYEHLESCDPVVSNGVYAFSTLRSGNLCGRTEDVLDVINVEDLSKPTVVTSFSLNSPYGLGLMGDNLFIGEKKNGMLWLDVSDVNQIQEINRFADIEAIDFIVDGDEMIIQTTSSMIQVRVNGTGLEVISEVNYDE